MAIFQIATNTPAKSEIISRWIVQQPWGPSNAAEVELIGSFHLDDPEGEVGMQTFVVRAAQTLFQVPLTYRDKPIPGGDESFVAEMEHSVLGTRFVYDGLGDPCYITVVAGVAVCGYGQALGFARHEDRWYAVPDGLLVRGAGSLGGRVAVDGFTLTSTTDDAVVLHNERIELTIFRTLHDRPVPAIGLTATWPGQPAPIALIAAHDTEGSSVGSVATNDT